MKINSIPAVEYADDQIRKFKIQRVESLYRSGKIELEDYAKELRRITQQWNQATQKWNNGKGSSFYQPYKNSHTSA